jgi:hypothetical protein
MSSNCLNMRHARLTCMLRNWLIVRSNMRWEHLQFIEYCFDHVLYLPLCLSPCHTNYLPLSMFQYLLLFLLLSTSVSHNLHFPLSLSVLEATIYHRYTLSSPHSHLPISLFSLPLSHTSPYCSTRVRSSWHVLPIHPRNGTHRGQSVSSRAWRAHLHLDHLIVPCPFSFYNVCIFISASSIRLHYYQTITFFILYSPYFLFFPLSSRMILYSSRIPYIISITRPSWNKNKLQ